MLSNGVTSAVLLLLPLAHAVVVDRILHVVGARTVTVSDVLFETEIDPCDHSPIAALEDPAYGYESRLVDYAIIRNAAAETDVFKPTGSEVDTRWDRFRACQATSAAYDELLRRWGLDDEALKGFFYSRMVVEHFVQRNLVLSGNGSRYEAWVGELRERAVIRSPGAP